MWRQPVDRLRARVVRDATIFTGLDSMTMPLLQRLAETGRASIVVIEPDRNHPLLDEARATGARVMIGVPSSPRVLLPIIAGWRGCALRRLYALRDDVPENEAILAAAETILGRYQPDPDRQPHLVARIDDPRHADHWRGWHSRPVQPVVRGRAQLPRNHRVRTARPGLPPSGPAAAAVRGQHAGPGHPARTGPAGLGTAGTRGGRGPRQRAEGRAASNGAGPHHPDPEQSGPLPVQRVLLLDRRAEDLRREYLATSPAPLVEALCEVTAEPCAWQDELLACWTGCPRRTPPGPPWWWLTR